MGVIAILFTAADAEACQCLGPSEQELRDIDRWCADGHAVVVSGTVERVRRSAGTETGAHTIQLGWDDAEVRPALPPGYPHERLQFGVWGDCVVPPRPGTRISNRAVAVRDTPRGPQLFAQDCVVHVGDDLCNTGPPGQSGCRSCNVGTEGTPLPSVALAVGVVLAVRLGRRGR